MMYDDLRTQLEQVGRLPVPEPRPEFTDSLLARLHAVEQVSSMGSPAAPAVMRGAHRLRIVTAGAVAAAFLSVVGYVSMQGADEVPITMTASFGTVEVTRDDGTVLLNPGGETRLQPGDTVYVSGGSKVEIGGDEFEGGENGIALVVGENGVTPPVSAEITLATDDPTTSTDAGEEATTTASETSEAPVATEAADQPRADAVEKGTGDDGLGTTTGSNASTPQPTAEKAPPTTAAPAPTEPIIVEPSEVATTVPTTVPARENARAVRLDLPTITTDGEKFTLAWKPYEGDDFGCYLILYTTGNDPRTTDTTSFPLGGSNTKMEGQPIFDRALTRREINAPISIGVVRYRVVATDGACTSPTTDARNVDYGNLVALSDEVQVSLQQSNPASSVVQHSNRAEFKPVGVGDPSSS